MSTEDVVDAITGEAKVALDGLKDLVQLERAGDWLAFGKRAAELAVDLVPPELLREYLDAAAVRRANAAANALEDAKFGPKP